MMHTEKLCLIKQI